MNTTKIIILLVFCAIIPMVAVAYYIIDKGTDSLFYTYKVIEDTVRNDPKLLFQMEQTLFPSTNYRFWQLDGIETVPFLVCLILHEKQTPLKCNTTSSNMSERWTTKNSCWNFRWTNSVLLNNIPGDILLAMDTTIVAMIYSGIIGSGSNRKLSMYLNIVMSPIFCEISADHFEQALALYLSRSKGVIKSKVDIGYHSYIAKEYTYFGIDPYFSKLVSKKSATTNPLLSLWVTFIFLNVLIPILFTSKGRMAFKTISKYSASFSPRVPIAISMVLILFNLLYTISTLIFHIQGYPNVLQCHLITTARRPCRIPRSATFYNYVIGILITKAIVLPLAVTTELIAAVHIIRGSSPINKRQTSTITLVLKIFTIWQVFVFVQITVGLISIPLLLLTLISPTYSILTNGGLITLLLTLIVLLVNITLPSTKTLKGIHCFKWFIATAEMLILVACILCSFVSYYIIVTDGVDMSGIKGYIMSLLPSILITVFAWIVKKRYFGRKSQKKYFKGKESFSTDEELIKLSDYEPNV